MTELKLNNQRIEKTLAQLEERHNNGWMDDISRDIASVQKRLKQLNISELYKIEFVNDSILYWHPLAKRIMFKIQPNMEYPNGVDKPFLEHKFGVRAQMFKYIDDLIEEILAGQLPK